jgi:predicted nucleotidyltransferase
MHDWPGRSHAETLRIWPELVQTLQRVEERPDVFEGVLLLGSLARGEGDAISDVDMIAVTCAGKWQAGWGARHLLSAGALVTFDRPGDRPGVAAHNWLTPALAKVECLIAEPVEGGLRLYGDPVVLHGANDLPDKFERKPPLTRQEIEDYSDELREQNAIPEIERAYGDLIRLLRREVRRNRLD